MCSTGGAGDDSLIGRNGQDYLIGGAGNDFAYVGDGDVFLGGDDADIMAGSTHIVNFTQYTIGTGDHYADGGAGNDILMGALGVDVLNGGTGNDQLWGENRPAGWIGRVADGTGAFIPVAQQEFYSVTGAADYLDGGAGDDVLRGDGGDDVLIGGAGIDVLYGDDEFVAGVVEGDDFLDGGSEDDYLQGGGGQDVLMGGSGNDALIGDYVGRPALGADDILDGGAGNDQLVGGGGIDTLFGGADADMLWGDAGQDVLDGGSGNDELQGGTEADVLWGGTGNDRLFGEAGNDQLFGDEDHDVLVGEAGDDELMGGAGDDQLQGGDGNDVLVGGAGTDTLLGGAGADTYVFNLGDGVESIDDIAGANRLVFGAGISASDVGIGHGSLLIRVGLNGDLIHIENFNPANPTQSTGIESFEFADGLTRTQSQLLERGFDLVGSNGVDLLDGAETYQKIYGLGGNDVLTGGSLNNLIYGGTENDQVSGNAGDDQLLGEAGNDTLNGGTGNDVLIGGIGTDRLRGGTGQDRYLFNLGDGADLIVDTAGEGNRVVFGAGISAESVMLQLAGESALAIHTGQLGDQIEIISNVAAVDRSAVDSLEFANGSTRSIAQLLAQGIAFTGTLGGDVLTGTVQVDQISGLGGDDTIVGGLCGDRLFGNEGNDQLFGGDGDDRLDGGAGNDLLNGEAGEDTYVFGRGYGQDIVSDSPVEQNGPNTIQLTAGVSPGDVRLQARQSDDRVSTVLTIEGASDELTLFGTADPALLQISEIQFEDGTNWDTVQILNRIEGLRVTASESGSELDGTGFRDELIGAAGNDVLDGRGNADWMVGGDGDDWYWLDHPGDTVVELVGEGTDVVFSRIDYTLPEHVENLILWPTTQPATDPIHGEGNAGDNQLIGNFVSNVLVGGAGEDILYGGISVGGDYGDGNDDLFGGVGNDTYFAEGEFNGFDTIHDAALPGEGNRLQFGTSMRPADVVLVQEGARLKITNSGASHGVILADFDPTGVTGSVVTDVVAFSSGVEDVTGGYEITLLALMPPTLGTDNAETLVGSANAEAIKAGAGDDTLVGWAGNDVLIGGTGSDTYVLNQGDGFDLIDDQPGSGDVNRVQFGPGITQEMLRVSYSGTFGVGGVSIRIGTSGDGLHVLGVSAENPGAAHAVDVFHFADGSQVTFAQLFEREIIVQGTGGSDGELFGTVADDRMNGYGGSESLSGQAGSDTLEGGTGNDVLSGGDGEDTYVFNVGDGFDRIEDDAEFIDDGQEGYWANNRILFGHGIFLSDLSFLDVRSTIRTILVGSDGDRIDLPNFVDADPGLRAISFSDGLTVDIYDLRDRGQVTDDQTIQGGPGGGVLIGGTGNDVIHSGGGNTALIGGAGNDTLVGGTGHNWISGGPGNDFLIGGSGRNTFLLSPGSGRDAIQIPNYLALLDSSTARFSGGYNSYHPSLSVGSLVIRYGDLGDELHILDFDPNDVFATPAVQRFEFSDRVVTYEELIALGFDIEGTSGHDALTGTSTTDRFLGMDGDDHMSGGGGGDTFTGGLGNDTLVGGAGNDTLDGRAGKNLLIGGKGNDTFIVATATDVVSEGLNAGLDTVEAAITYVLGANVENLELTGAAVTGIGNTLNNVLTGNGENNILIGNTGHDTLEGEGGQDTVSGGIGNDRIVMDVAVGDVDVADGGVGSDTLALVGTAGGSGLVTVNLSAGLGDQVTDVGGTPEGLLQNNFEYLDASGLNGTVNATGSAGANLLIGSDGVDTLAGLAGNDILNGGAGDDTLLGGDGNDLVLIGQAADHGAGEVITGGAGTDGIWFISMTEDDTLTLSANTQVESVVITNAVGLTTGTTDVHVDASAVGTGLVMIGNAGDNVLIGTGGNDVLNGGAGDDELNGSGGTNLLIGGKGNDTFLVATATDLVSEALNGGIDTVLASLNYILGAHVENLTLTGNLAINGTGNALNNILIGNSGINVLTGGVGNDTYVVQNEADTVVEDLNAGIDLVLSVAATFTLGANVENLTLTGTNNINGTGNGLNNILIGNEGDNILSGDCARLEKVDAFNL